MATTTFTWSIDRISTFQEPEPNYVSEVTWSLIGNDTNYRVEIGDRTVLKQVESTFIPYNELTEATVISWLEDTLGVEGVAAAKAKVQGYIDNIISPPAVVSEDTPLPWVTQ
jgi:hypothetical protein